MSYDALGLRGGRLVEHRRRGGTPVDEEGVAVVVAQPDPADVARVVTVAVQVEASEDESFVRGVQRGEALGRLEDHRVPLDEAALVPEPAAAVALLGESLCVLRRLLELDVDAVDELLLLADLSPGQVVMRGLCGQGGVTVSSTCWCASVGWKNRVVNSTPSGAAHRTVFRQSGGSVLSVCE